MADCGTESEEASHEQSLTIKQELEAEMKAFVDRIQPTASENEQSHTAQHKTKLAAELNQEVVRRS